MQGWEPSTVVSDELVDPTPVAALAALFDDGVPAPGPGSELPPLWHWAALARWPVSSVLGGDGHPVRGSFLPPVGLPRRMFAGGEVVFHGPLRVGETVRRQSTVESVTEKSGRSGRLVWPYATRVEGYPGLVVHGPLMTLALAETLRLEGRPERVTRIAHRNNRPLFCGQRARLLGRRTADGFALDLTGPEGATTGPHTTLTATAR
ncbi:MaoC family dehydratase N-terminal domain-containing protein [Nonomuraea sp. NPDC003560]|uniref:FAS1-like dehydratase domain-containing protein n=1 Tax=Nonomuraea sp. NPDC003560 TaxID=3364341 RepID=UPI0036871B21